jgi:hypothetical protein
MTPVDAKNRDGTPTVILAPPRVQLGFNYAWGFSRYGLYFGPHVPNPILPLPAPTVPTDEADWPAVAGPVLRNAEGKEEDRATERWVGAFEGHMRWLKTKLKITVVRAFLLCNAINWGDVDASGRFRPPSYLHLRFRYHFRKMLQACANAGVQLIPCLVDFGIGNPDAPLERRLPIVTDDAIRTTFFDQVLEPLLDDAARFASTICAFEVMNEPSWLTGRFWPDFAFTKPTTWRPITAPVTDDQLIKFLADGVARIDRRNLFPSTVGHRLFSEMTKYPRGTKPQFHYYPRSTNHDPSELPDPKTTGLPVEPFLGEFGATPFHGGGWNECKGLDVGGTAQRVEQRLIAINAKHYGLALLWGDDPDPNDTTTDPLKLTGDAEQGILNFLSSHP